MPVKPDYRVTDAGSIILVHPLTPACTEWFDNNLPEEVSFFGDALAVERRYAGPLLTGMSDDGLLQGR